MQDSSDLPDPRDRLRRLAEERGTPLNGLSSMIGRHAKYLGNYINEGSPRSLSPADRHILARFFGVDETELGGGDPRWAKRKRA